jgi:hypothetical protein
METIRLGCSMADHYHQIGRARYGTNDCIGWALERYRLVTR